MNDKERDRSDDGAGPKRFATMTNRLTSGHSVVHINNRHTPKVCSIAMLWSLLFLFSTSIEAQISGRPQRNTLRGLSLYINAGVLKASDKTANFYNGNPSNTNTLDRIIHSETFGIPIWNDLTNQGLIGSAISSYRELTVAEYGDMSYNLAFQLGVGFRYDLGPDWAWQIRFDYAKLHAQGMVLLNSGKSPTILTNQDAYVNCPTSGLEERIYIDFGAIKKFKLQNGFDLEAQIGANVNNTKVESCDIKIGGHGYSMLDIWGGQYPSSFVGSYEYINEGGIGYGGYASLAFGFTLNTGYAMQLAYTFYYTKTTLVGYTCFAPQHVLTLNVYINNFSFFD